MQMTILQDASKKAKELSNESTKQENIQNTEKIDDLKEQLKQARLDFQKTTLKIQQEHPELLQYVAIKPSNIRSIQSKLPEDTVLIEPVILDDQIIIFVGTPGKNAPIYKIYDLKDSGISVLSYLKEFRKAIYDKDKQTLLSTSQQLYDILIKPVEEEIAPYKVLVISPYENLRYIPFQALYDGDKYLIEKYSVVNATSASGLKIGSEQQVVHKSSLLAFGNATKDLPGSETEVKSISKNFPEFKIYLRDEAKKDII